MSRARRYDTPRSIVLMDIDFFKRYNDTHGHPAGDKLLFDISVIISSEVREADFVARYGGEEFLAVLPDTDAAGAAVLAERIRSRVEEKAGITVSLGVSSYLPGMEREDELICQADNALYRAKSNGRNRVEVSASGRRRSKSAGC